MEVWLENIVGSWERRRIEELEGLLAGAREENFTLAESGQGEELRSKLERAERRADEVLASLYEMIRAQHSEPGDQDASNGAGEARGEVTPLRRNAKRLRKHFQARRWRILDHGSAEPFS